MFIEQYIGILYFTFRMATHWKKNTNVFVQMCFSMGCPSSTQDLGGMLHSIVQGLVWMVLNKNL